jgi:hypothetical protein
VLRLPQRLHLGWRESGRGEYLPFDIDAFEDWPGKLPRANQASAFRELNKIIHRYASQNDQNTDIADLIESWYDGNVASGSYQAFRDFFDCNPSPNKLPKVEWFGVVEVNGTQVPKYQSFCDLPPDLNAINTYVRDWNLYQFGYAKYCRLCHVAQAGLAQTGSPQTNVFVVGNWLQSRRPDRPNAVGPNRNLPSEIAPNAGMFNDPWATRHICEVAYPRMPHAELTDERVRTDAFPSHGTEPIRPYNLICNP